MHGPCHNEAVTHLGARIRDEWTALRLAVGFFTVIPLPPVVASLPAGLARASVYLPVVGWIVGGLTSLVLVAPLPLPQPVVAACALGVALWATGLLHTDGLADSADALLASVPPARRLEILRDVHVGAFALAVVPATLLLWWTLLASPIPWWAPLVAATVGRFAVTGPMNTFPNARAGTGLGGAARGGPWLASAVFVLPVLALPSAWIAALVALAVAWTVSWWASRRLGGGLTGDVLGATILLSEIAALVPYAWG